MKHGLFSIGLLPRNTASLLATATASGITVRCPGRNWKGATRSPPTALGLERVGLCPVYAICAVAPPGLNCFEEIVRQTTSQGLFSLFLPPKSAPTDLGFGSSI